jgi:hypothetical protein
MGWLKRCARVKQVWLRDELPRGGAVAEELLANWWCSTAAEKEEDKLGGWPST